MSNGTNWLRGCLVTTLLAALCAVASAQTVTVVSADTVSSASEPVDYSLLNNPAYDYIDLRQAQNLGYSDGEIASIAKIARLTGLPFKFVLNQVHEGRTFALLASEYNLKLADVLDASDERARIDQYLQLYQSLDSLGTEHSAMISSAQSVSGPTLTELEASYNQLNAAFPALPPTNIETTPYTSASTEITTTQMAPPPVVAAPPPPPAETNSAPPAAPQTAALQDRSRRVRHHRVRRPARAKHRHRRHHAAPMRMGS